MAVRARQIYRRIQNVRHVRQITKAMYTIATTQVMQRKRVLLAARPFGAESRQVLADLVAAFRQGGLSHPLVDGVGQPGTAVLVINTDRGLCGRYVGDVNRAADHFCRGREGVRLLVGGDKANRHFRGGPWPIVRRYLRLYDRPNLDIARAIQADLLALYGRDVGEAYAVYMYFRGELSQQVRVERLLPLALPEGRPRDLLVEPGLPQVVNELARLVLLGRIYEILVDAKTSEHAIRRQAMKAATDNADELMEKLTLNYNKARQHRITTELADIMGGAEAVRD
ncbi:MAG: ATP synthase F1 subunit gamma [Candidatus Acetothermia bacterium]|jgi:F-type H+-transporting ATPase subunit gamma|nr:ATP synthase F1 subunit gamma [Candidatus Acetothermia bacterium]